MENWEQTVDIMLKAAVFGGVLAVVWSQFVNRGKADAAAKWKELHDANEASTLR